MADIGTGASLTFSSATESYDVLSIDVSDVSRPSVDTSHLGTTTARTFIPGDLYDPGTMEIEYLLDPSTMSTNRPIIDNAAETITLQWAEVTSSTATNAAGGKFSASGFATSWSCSTPLEDRITATLGFKFSGAITFTNEV